jgi:hypothetical protein
MRLRLGVVYLVDAFGGPGYLREQIGGLVHWPGLMSAGSAGGGQGGGGRELTSLGLTQGFIVPETLMPFLFAEGRVKRATRWLIPGREREFLQR